MVPLISVLSGLGGSVPIPVSVLKQSLFTVWESVFPILQAFGKAYSV